MTSTLPETPAHLVAALQRATRAYPLERKLLVAGRPAIARQLLELLARSGTPWIGWEASSPTRLAQQLAGRALAAEHLALADEFDVQALVDEAIDQVTSAGRAGPFGRPGGGRYREALHETIGSLRAAGVTAVRLAQAASGDEKLTALGAVLAAYEDRLAGAERTDFPGVFQRACSLLESGAGAAADARIYLVPGQPSSGLLGRFLRLLATTGAAEILAADPVLGLEPADAGVWREAEAAESPLSRLHEAPDPAFRPRDVALFAAATPSEELRQIVRQVVAAGVPWDDVEIVAAEPWVYAPALDGLACALAIPVTYGCGLDVGRTRVGRAVAEYLEWVAGGFQDHVLWSMLSGGLLAPPDEGVSAIGLARALRRLRIGWGYDKYQPALQRELERLAQPLLVGDEEDEEDAQAGRERARSEMRALADLTEALLSATPRLPEPGSPAAVSCAPAAIARGLLELLRHVPSGDAAENNARDVIAQRLKRIEAVLVRETSWTGAVSVVQGHLHTRTSPVSGEGAVSGWTPAAGHLHLADVESGGLSGRRHTYVVGLSAGATSAGPADPLLTDGDWLRIQGNDAEILPPTAYRMQATRHAVAALLARVRGSVTLSYSAWDPTEGRAVAPAAELLQVYRHRYANPARTYRQMDRALGSLACRVPAGSSADATDIWLAALDSGRRGAFRRADAAVAALTPFLGRGVLARAARQRPEVNEFRGLIGPRPELDPRSQPGLVLSPSRLEMLGACPGHYFYRYVLGVAPVEDAEWDPQTWLDAGQRGTLLHDVYEATLRGAAALGAAPGSTAMQDVARQALAEALRRWRQEVPVPNEGVYAVEAQALAAEVESFLSMIERDAPVWRELEFAFGPEHGRPVAIPVSGGNLQIRGRIDRIDAHPGGGLRVVDYKTGSPAPFAEQKPFAGGRRVQHILYAAAAERWLHERVKSAEYHFPTIRGEHRTIRYTLAPEDARRVLDRLIKLLVDGTFVGTDEGKDCRYCEFGPACRVQFDAYGSASGGPPAWMRDLKKQVKAETLERMPAACEALLALRSER